MEIDTRVLGDLLQGSFNTNELIQLCHDLAVNYEDLYGPVHSVKVISLVGYMERNNRLEDLVDAIIRRRPGLKGELSPELCTIPVIVAAMTSDEATGLKGDLEALREPYTIGENTFQPDPHNLEMFQRFSQLISSPDLDSLLGRYGVKRDDWRSHDQIPVGRLVKEMTDRLGYEVISLSDVVLSADPSDTPRRVRATYDLQRTSCLLIIDGLSLFHPRLRRLLSNSGLVTGAKPITTLMVTPIAPSHSDLAQRLEADFRDSEHFSAVFFRFEEHDLLCDFGSFNQRNIRRWLDVTLPQTAKIITGEDPNAERIESMRGSLQREEAGMGRIIGGEVIP